MLEDGPHNGLQQPLSILMSPSAGEVAETARQPAAGGVVPCALPREGRAAFSGCHSVNEGSVPSADRNVEITDGSVYFYASSDALHQLAKSRGEAVDE